MRVTQNMMTNNLLRNLQRNLSRLEKLHDEMATGKKMRRPADDPANLVNALRNRSQRTEISKYKANVTDALTWLENSDAALSEAGNVLQRVRELTVSGSTGTNPDQAKNAIADEIAQLRDHLAQIANSRVGDRYIFGGTNTMNPPVILGTGTATWQGNAKQINFEIGQGVTVPVNVDGGKVFGGLKAKLATVSNNVTGIYLGTNLGAAVTRDANLSLETIPNPSVARDEVTKLQTAFPTTEYNDYQVIVSLGQAENSFAIDPDNKVITISFDEETTTVEAQNEYLQALAVAEEDAVPEAAFFRFYEAAQEVPGDFEGVNTLAGGVDSIAAFDPVTNLMTVGQTFAFDGYTVHVSTGAEENDYNIDHDNKVITIDFDANTTTVNAQNNFLNQKFQELEETNSPLQFYAPAVAGEGVISSELDEDKIVVTLSDGDITELVVVDRNAAVINFHDQDKFAGISFGIDPELGVDETTGASFTITDDSLFTLLDDIVTALRGGIDVGGYLDELDRGIDNLLAIQADVGARVNRLEMSESWLTDLNYNLTMLSSKLEDVDMADAITRFTALENIYRAALSTGARIVQPSLVDFLR